MKLKSSKADIIVLSGGLGNRFESEIPKQFHAHNGTTILEMTLESLNSHPKINNIILVINEAWIDLTDSLNLNQKFEKLNSNFVLGGETRRISAENGVKHLLKVHPDAKKILIHDAVRPFVSNETINNCIQGLNKYDAVYPAVPAIDTIIKSDNKVEVDEIPDRNKLLRGQTPQGFNVEILKRLFELTKKDSDVDSVTTNECAQIKRYDLCPVGIVKGNVENIKITNPSDFELIEKNVYSYLDTKSKKG